MLTVFWIAIPIFEDSLFDRKREMIHQLANTGWSTLTHYEKLEREGVLTRDQAQSEAISQLMDMRYGAEGKDYFWINDQTPRLVMHPYRQDLVGRDLSNFADAHGKLLFMDFVRTVDERGEGYVDYMWQWKDDSTRVVPKISYVKGFAPWGWTIGTGMYVDDVKAEISHLTRKITWLTMGILAVLSIGLVCIVRGRIRAERRRLEAERLAKETENRLRVKLDVLSSGEHSADDLNLTDIIDLRDLQEIQDRFARATGVASIIIDSNGKAITGPSNFCRVCEIVCETPKGRELCNLSDRAREEKTRKAQSPVLHECLSCGFVDASAPIIVAGRHIASWLIGQTNALGVSREKIRRYAIQIGADVDEMLAAFEKMPRMSIPHFQEILDLFWIFAKEISTLGYKNLLLARDVTVSKRAEEVQSVLLNISQAVNSTRNLGDLLRIIHEQLGSLINATNFFVALYNPDRQTYSFPYCVDTYDTAPDLTPEQARGTLTDYVRRNGMPLLAAADAQRRLTEKGETMLVGSPSEQWLGAPLRTPDGMIGVVAVQSYTDGKCYSDDDLKLIEFVSDHIAMAISRKQAEEALTESQRALSILMSNLPGMAYRCRNDKDWTMSFVSEGCAALTGYSPEDLVDNRIISYDELILPEYRDEMWQEVQQALEEHRSFTFTYRIKTINGDEKWVWEQGRGVYSETGQLQALEGFIADVTDQKKAEDALRESEERFRVSFLTSPDAINLNTVEEGVFKDINTSFTSLSGYTREEVIGKSSLEIDLWYNPEDRALMVTQLQEKGYVNNFEVKFRIKGGEVRTGLLSAKIIVLNGHKYILSITRDIEEWKRAEVALRTAEEKVRSFIESVDDMVYFYGTDGSLVMMNDAASKITGYTQHELEHDPQVWRDMVPREDRNLVKEFRKAHPNGVPLFTFEYRLKTKSGDTRWFSSRRVGVQDTHGKYIGYNCIDRDITALKKTEAELRDSREKLRELADLLPQTVFELDTDGIVTYVNRFGTTFTGYTPKDVGRGLFFEQLFASEDVERIRQAFGALLNSGEPGQGEFRLIKKDGSTAVVAVYASPIIRDSQPKGVRGIIVDLTETKRLQEFAGRAQRLETAGRIAGQVAHDFNNLLGPLVAYPDLIRPHIDPDSKVMKFVGDMQKAALQISEINQQLLTLGRRGHYNQELINLNELLTEVVDQMYPVPETLKVEVDKASNLMNVSGGRSQVLRVISNLVTNARDAMGDVGTLDIRTENFYVDETSGTSSTVPQGEYVKLTVGDTGCGISPEILSKVFDPFFTTKSAGHSRGSGLGLSIVHAVVEDHHGYIDFTSNPGKGTRFYLYFPISRATAEESVSDQIVGGDETIMVVDDDPIQREVTRNLLEKLGYQVCAADSGERAIELLREKACDLLVLDMIMRNGIDGAETYKRARALNDSQKAIIVSGFAETGRVEAALNLGAGDFIRKPLTMKSLAQAVRRELDRTAKWANPERVI